MPITKQHTNLCVAMTTLFVVWYLILSEDHSTFTSGRSNKKGGGLVTITGSTPQLKIDMPSRELEYYNSRSVVFNMILSWYTKVIPVSGQSQKTFIDIDARYGAFALYAANLGVTSVTALFTSPDHYQHFLNSVQVGLGKWARASIGYTVDASAKNDVVNTTLLFPDGATSLVYVNENPVSTFPDVTSAMLDVLARIKTKSVGVALVEGVSSATQGRMASSELQCAAVALASGVCPEVVVSSSSQCVYNAPAVKLPSCSAKVSAGCLLVVTASDAVMLTSCEDPMKAVAALPPVAPQVGGIDTLSVLLLSAPALVGVILLWNLCKNWRTTKR